MFRQIFVDVCALPENHEPSWMGYSVGRWHGDVLVVIDDPKAYTGAIRYTQPQVLLPGTELLEYIRSENAKGWGQAGNP